MKAAFEGAISLKPTLKIEGTLAADAGFIAQMRWCGPGKSRRPAGGFGRFAIKARTNVIAGTISLSSVNSRARRQRRRRACLHLPPTGARLCRAHSPPTRST
jgi:hypothetical protein